MHGAANFQIRTALAAVAACSAQSVSIRQIKAGLIDFQNAANPGRTDFYRVRDGYVLINYGRNPTTFRQSPETPANWRERRTIGVTGVPDDCSDEFINRKQKRFSPQYRQLKTFAPDSANLLYKRIYQNYVLDASGK